ncbi:MAG: hypothetical protein AB2L20_29015 [Mangrovibacterium sp.]
MSSSDFLSSAPKFITARFNSVNKYVWQTLFSEQIIIKQTTKFKTKVERRKEISRLKSISDEASTVIFLFLINKFFTEGAKAARQAVDTFKELGVDGFFIGRNYFSERNENVKQGDDISEKLLSSIQDIKVKELITQSHYVSEILDKYRSLL